MKHLGVLLGAFSMIIISLMVNGLVCSLLWGQAVIPMVDTFGYTLPTIPFIYWTLLFGILYTVRLAPSKNKETLELTEAFGKLFVTWILKLSFAYIIVLVVWLCI
jgi:hypothetical protein